jgi:YgiT-type zinc finger domain-containing protein
MNETREMKCYFCGGEVIARTVTHIRETPNGVAEFREVPCEECTACGERYFSPETIRRLEELSAQPPAEYVQVPAYDYAG